MKYGIPQIIFEQQKQSKCVNNPFIYKKHMFMGKKLHHIYLFVLLQIRKNVRYKKGNAMKKINNCSQAQWAYKKISIKSLDKIIDISYCEIAQFQL